MSNSLWHRYPKKYKIEIINLLETCLLDSVEHFFKAIEKGKISESIYQIENGFAYKSDTSLDIQFLKRLLAFLSVVSELNRNQKEAILYTLDRIQKKLGDSLNG